jgi:ubiquinone/menaquinone biosynthesis C-methylase UbiE
MMSAPMTATSRTWEGWQLQGSSAEAYERFLVPAATRRWAEHLIGLAEPHTGQRVLDVGCGTGIVARTVAERVGGARVTGLDLNEDMLEVARQNSATEIDWRQGDAVALPFVDDSFDLVYCQYAIQFFPDPIAALREMRRVLSPDGRLALMTGRSVEHNRVYGWIAAAMGRHAGPQAGMMMRSPFPDWTTADLRDLVIAAGFADARLGIHIMNLRYPSAADLLWQEASYSPLAGVFAALDPATRDALVVDVTQALTPYTDDDGIVFPIESQTVIAT